ncbi:MAG: hypothetical protein E2P02_19945 [Acidobacteria bacterium]|nr:MAG: hypothetical protein E2P02_19945 [Acidobacteriota bacterium]
MAKTKKKKAATKKRAVAKPKDNSTEIVFSHGEIDFLRKITGKDADGSTPKNKRARLSLRDKLLEINFGAPQAGGGLIVLALLRPEVELLQRTTKEVYSFITAEERRARLILREKILIAVEKVTGRKILPE